MDKTTRKLMNKQIASFFRVIREFRDEGKKHPFLKDMSDETIDNYIALLARNLSFSIRNAHKDENDKEG